MSTSKISTNRLIINHLQCAFLHRSHPNMRHRSFFPGNANRFGICYMDRLGISKILSRPKFFEVWNWPPVPTSQIRWLPWRMTHLLHTARSCHFWDTVTLRRKSIIKPRIPHMETVIARLNPAHPVDHTAPLEPNVVGGEHHWGRTHEGVGRHPRQDGGGLLHRFGKLQANLQTRRIYWRPILLEVIVASMRHTEAEFQVVIGSHLAVIPSWKVAWWRGWCAFHFSRCRGWLFSVSRVTPRWTRVTHA